jgi:phosphoribosyl 1,2-cyclic phosphodiesterase
MFTVKFWGVRGSIASAGAATAQVGGNTSCVELRCGERGNEEIIILDAGTGLRPLGADLLDRGGPMRAHLLVSHLHWDHIQGFPFFVPAYLPGNRLTVHGPAGEGDAVGAVFAAQMRAPHFPVGLDAMKGSITFQPAIAGMTFAIGAATVKVAAARHPNGCLAYRIESGGRSLVYATDTEHDAESGRVDENLLELAKGTDLLIYDAQYTPEEYRAGKVGWGHSTAQEGARLAAAAGAGKLVLFHHDPSHDDWAVARIEAETRNQFAGTVAAREGLVITLDDAAAAAA